MKLYNIEFEGINGRDYPDFSDAYISYAEHEDGTPLTQEELDSIDSSDTYEYLMKHLY